MSYTLSGRLIGLLCDECSEPLAGATLRFVRVATLDGIKIDYYAAMDLGNPEVVAAAPTRWQEASQHRHLVGVRHAC